MGCLSRFGCKTQSYPASAAIGARWEQPVLGLFPGIPKLIFLVGAREQREQHWTLSRHVHPILGTADFIRYCFSSLGALFICSPRCTESPYTTETHMPAASRWGMHFMQESKPHESRTQVLTLAVGCTKSRHQRVTVKNKRKWENTGSAWRR